MPISIPITTRTMRSALLALLLVASPLAAQSRAAAATPLVIGETFTMPARAIGGELRRINVYAARGWGDSAGESLAGLFVVETFLLEPGMFDTYVAFDPSLWWNGGRMVRESRARVRDARGRPARPRAMWLASSDERDMVRLVGQLADTLQRVAPPGLVTHYEPLPEEGHGTIYHPAALLAFRSLFAPPSRK